MVTAIVHLAGHIAGPPAATNDTERQLLEVMTTYRFQFPGGAERTMMQMMNGFSLILSVLFAGLGAMGLVVAKRGQHDAQLMYAAARTFTLGGPLDVVAPGETATLTVGPIDRSFDFVLSRWGEPSAWRCRPGSRSCAPSRRRACSSPR